MDRTTQNEHYEGLAEELLQANEALLHQPAQHLLEKLTHGEQFVLNYLFTHQRRAHPTELSRGLVVSTARIAALLGRLEDKGLLNRVPDPLDNRQVVVTLTPKGREAILTLRRQAIRSVAALLEQLGPEDAAEYIRLHKKLSAVHSK